jgi:hypothetical protein
MGHSKLCGVCNKKVSLADAIAFQCEGCFRPFCASCCNKHRDNCKEYHEVQMKKRKQFDAHILDDKCVKEKLDSI